MMKQFVDCNKNQACGAVSSHVVFSDLFNSYLHPDIIPALQVLRNRGRQFGFELTVVSGFRDAKRQLAIWNGKMRGERQVLDVDENPIDIMTLSIEQRIETVLRFSALPGASRHHWGTDIDVIDANAVTENYQVQLTMAETEDDGPFAPFHQWLSKELDDEANPGFYRPYKHDKGGVAPEAWHLSYHPVAKQFEKNLTLDVLTEFICHSDIEHRSIVLAKLSDIYQRFVLVD